MNKKKRIYIYIYHHLVPIENETERKRERVYHTYVPTMMTMPKPSIVVHICV